MKSRVTEEPEPMERSELKRKPESIGYGSTEKDEDNQESSFISEKPRITMKDFLGASIRNKRVSDKGLAAGGQSKRLAKRGQRQKTNKQTNKP